MQTKVLIVALLIPLLSSCFSPRKLYYGLKFKRLHETLVGLEHTGRRPFCARQIQSELVWLYYDHPDLDRIGKRLSDLSYALEYPEKMPKEDTQSPEDGSYGRCFEEWFFKLNESFDRFSGLSQAPQVPPSFLDRINTPEKLTLHMRSILISDVKNPLDSHYRELNETTAALLRMLLRGIPKNYPNHPELEKAFLDFVMNELRDPQTGYWGVHYRDGNTIRRSKDLSTSFHIISYLKGEVPDWPKIIDTTLKIKDQDFPEGWLMKGEYWNHLSMDVIEIFRLGWPHADPAQRIQISSEIQKLLDHALHDTLLPDGQFKLSKNDESLEDAMYYGTETLRRAGYFDRKLRFWTDQDFKDSAQIKSKILAQVKSRIQEAAPGSSYQTLLENLQ